jgi:hypothetical protein
VLPVADRRLQHITMDTMGVFSILKQAQMAAPLPPQQQQQARHHRRRRRAGTKGRKRGWRWANSQWQEQVRCGHRRYRPAAQPEDLPEEPAAVWRPWGEATEWPGAAAYKGGGEAQLLEKKQLQAEMEAHTCAHTYHFGRGAGANRGQQGVPAPVQESSDQ